MEVEPQTRRSVRGENRTLRAEPTRPGDDPMQIELFGCSSAGKSSLAPRLLRSARALGVEATMSEDFVLGQFRLGGVRLPWLRRLCVDLLAAGACLASWREHAGFLHQAARILLALPAGVAWGRRLNMARNVVKKTGVRALVRRRARPDELVILDEGTLQTAHYLFVQPCADPDPARLDAFLARVPLPDVAVYVRETEPTLVRRTLARGHKRLGDRSSHGAARFVKRAVFTLDRVAETPRVKQRLLLLEPSGRSVSPAPSAAGRAGQFVREILRRATGAAQSDASAPPESAGVAS
jgi:hypothetical protein